MSQAQSKIEDMEEIIKKQESKSRLHHYKNEGTALVLSIVVRLIWSNGSKTHLHWKGKNRNYNHVNWIFPLDSSTYSNSVPGHE